MEGTPLLDVMRGLILEPEAQADFAADPSGYMQRFGYEDVPEDDLREAAGLVADTLPPDVAHAVNTAAAAEPADGDTFGDGSVGLLGRLSTVEVTESVVPELDDLPDAPPDEAAVDDAFTDDHDATTFGDVTRDFDEDADAAGDADDGTDGADEVAADASADDVAADDAGEAAAGAGDLADAAGQDVSFGDGGFDDAGAGESFGAGEAEAFGQGSAADVDDDPALADDGGLDIPTADADGADVDSFAPDPSFVPEPEPEPDPDADAFDDAGYDDSFDDGPVDGDVGHF